MDHQVSEKGDTWLSQKLRHQQEDVDRVVKKPSKKSAAIISCTGTWVIQTSEIEIRLLRSSSGPRPVYLHCWVWNPFVRLEFFPRCVALPGKDVKSMKDRVTM